MFASDGSHRAPPGASRFLLPALLLACSSLVTSCNDDRTSGTTPLEGAGIPKASTGDHSRTRLPHAAAEEAPVVVELFAPEDGDQVGVDGVGWFVDIAVEFEGGLRNTGFAGNQLTGPGGHQSIPPFPGTFAPGRDERFKGLVTLISTTAFGAHSCQNLANLFNLTGVTDRAEDETEIWDTWIISAAAFGRRTESTVYVAEVADRNHNGVFDDAPDVVPDANHDGACGEADLRQLGLASEIATATFFIR